MIGPARDRTHGLASLCSAAVWLPVWGGGTEPNYIGGHARIAILVESAMRLDQRAVAATYSYLNWFWNLYPNFGPRSYCALAILLLEADRQMASDSVVREHCDCLMAIGDSELASNEFDVRARPRGWILRFRDFGASVAFRRLASEILTQELFLRQP